MKLLSSVFPKSLLLLALSAGVFASQAQAQTLEQRLERLERMANNPLLLEMTRKMNDQEREIQSLQDRLDRLQNNAQVAGETLGKTNAPTQSDAVDSERVAELQIRLEKALQTLEVQGARIVLLESDLRQMKEQATVPNSTPVAQNSVPTTPVVPATASNALPTLRTRPATAAEQQAYQQAFALMRNSDYDGSIQAFAQFIESAKESDLAANAYYWKGEGHFIKDEFEQAYQAFQASYQQYPQSAKMADAMLRAADSLDKLTRLEEAKALYQQVVKQFAGSRAATNAQKRLEKF
ncbi:MAG: tol-pal system protein YbgF [Thiotrichales bacterium]|nr:tol-pal system protein YbgF [Thiotrichales bacterium]